MTLSNNFKKGIAITLVIVFIGLLIWAISSTVILTSTTTKTKTNTEYSIDLQTAAEIHYRHIENEGKSNSDMTIVYEAKTDGIIIYTVQSSDGTIEDRVAFVLDELWDYLK